jgi:hypothetical protein
VCERCVVWYALTWSVGSAREITGPRSDANPALSLLVLRNGAGTKRQPLPPLNDFFFSLS